MFTRLMRVTGLAAGLMATTLHAQATPPAGGPPGPQGPGAMRPRMPMPKMAMGGGPAAHVLAMRQQFNLTDDQVKKLEAMKTAQQTALEPPRAAMLRAQADLMDATKGDGDLAAARKAMEKMAQVHIDHAMAMLKAHQDVRAILTTDQKAKFDAMRREHMRGMGGMMGHGRMGGMGGMGPMDHEMPMDGMGPMKHPMPMDGPPQKP